MNPHASPIERDQRSRGIVVDNAFRPGKGSRPRPYSTSRSDYERRYNAIFRPRGAASTQGRKEVAHDRQ